MKATSTIVPLGKLRQMPIKELLRVAEGCQIEHDKKAKVDPITIIESCHTIHEWGTLFSANELSDAAMMVGLTTIDPDEAKFKADTEALARFHALVSDCDHWYLAYSFFIGDTEHGFLWETPFDEIHQRSNNVKTWYDGCGTDTYITIAYSSMDPKLHYQAVKKCKDLVNVQFIGAKRR